MVVAENALRINNPQNFKIIGCNIIDTQGKRPGSSNNKTVK
jgi:hypothetical protein